MKTTIEFTVYTFEDVVIQVSKYLKEGFTLIEIHTNRIYGDDSSLSVSYYVTMIKKEKEF